MPKFLESKLKAEYGQHSAVPYKVMNSIGAMIGNKETPKGAAMQAKHDAKAAPAPKASGKFPHRNLGNFLHQKKSR